MRGRQNQLRRGYARNRARHRSYNNRWLNRHHYFNRYPFGFYYPFFAYPWFGFSLAWGWPYYYPGFGFTIGYPLWWYGWNYYYPPYYYRTYLTIDTSSDEDVANALGVGVTTDIEERRPIDDDEEAEETPEEIVAEAETGSELERPAIELPEAIDVEA